jgi:uncharacterized membrane protein YbhN (UPF0104 family)
MFPITPGNLGTFQIACVFSMTTLFNVPKESAVSFSIVLHLLDLVPIFIGGLLFLYLDHMRFTELREEALGESEDPCDDQGQEVAVEGE